MTDRFCFESLRDFIAYLEGAGELVRIKELVSPMLEITEITDRVSKSLGGGKALFFENVEGSSIPVLINTFGSQRRMTAALGVENFNEIAHDIDSLIHTNLLKTLERNWQCCRCCIVYQNFHQKL